jgi:serine/threonine-protein kinase HipA
LSAQADIYNVVKAEFVAMRLASHVGLNVAAVRLTQAAGKDVLLIERFDREWIGEGWTRRAMVSGLTLLGLDEMMARYASYQDFGEIIRLRFQAPRDRRSWAWAGCPFQRCSGSHVLVRGNLDAGVGLGAVGIW